MKICNILLVLLADMADLRVTWSQTPMRRVDNNLESRLPTADPAKTDTWYSWVRFFFHFTNGTQKNRLNELVLLCIQNICEHWRVWNYPQAITGLTWKKQVQMPREHSNSTS